jgi:uncharacterized protein
VDLRNETRINVAQLMQEDVGAHRTYNVSLDWFALDEDLMAKDVEARVRLTRISDGILASGSVTGTALVECVRCLEIYEQPFATSFDQQYHPLIDVRSGVPVEQPSPEEEQGTIDEVHELNLAEPMRQVAILEVPIKPICREDCPGIRAGAEEVDDVEDDAVAADRRLSVLSQLLEDDNDDDNDVDSDADTTH